MTDNLSVLERQGLAWVDRLTSGEATERDLIELRQWQGQSEAHAQAFSDAVRLRRTVRAMRTADEADNASSTGRVAGASVRRPVLTRRVILGGGGALAASVAAYAVVRPPLDLWPSLEVLNADYRTGKGERRLVEVGGARVELNTQTAVSRADGGMRLIDGEAAVEVATSPFTILAGAGRVVAREARLNIRCVDGEISVACLSGQVQVSHRSGGELDLKPGDLASYGAAGLSAVQRINTDSVEAWRRGLLFFRDAPLSEVVAEVNRYRPGRIVIRDSEAANRRFNGVFRIDRMDDVLTQIRAAVGGGQTLLPGGVILLG